MYNDDTEVTDVVNMDWYDKYHDIFSKKQANIFWNLKKGSSFRLTNVGTLSNGKRLDLKFTLESNPKLIMNKQNSTVDLDYAENLPDSDPYKKIHVGIAKVGDYFKPTVILQSQASDKSLMFYYNNNRFLDWKVEFLSEGQPVKLALSSIITDIDYFQKSRLVFNEVTLKEQVPDRARLEDKGDHLFKARFNSGTNNDNTDIPKGSYLTAGYGTSFMYHHGTEHEDYPEYTYASDKVLSFYTGGSQFNLFGQSGHIVTHSSVIKPTLKEKLPLLPNPELSLREVPEKPKAPTVTYHFETLSYQPTVRKAVTNEDRVNIQNALISKQSIVRWELQTDALPTGREEMHHYSFKDVLPKGYVLDVEESQKASSNYTLTYDKETHTVVLQATPETLANMNKNREMAYNVPTPVLLGKVMDENTTYNNTFELSINNEYSVHSNVVTVSTPHNPNPEKHNYNKDQKMIDGKAVPKSALNHYALSWDFSINV